MTLFLTIHDKQDDLSNSPLAYSLRPQDLDHYVGQSHLCGPDAPIRRMIENKQVRSVIFWGPAGTGKTTLAKLISSASEAHFIAINAVSGQVKDIKAAIEQAQYNDGKTVLFIDEIHRFNKSQQDALLPSVESGLLTLIGATTENPYFYVNSGLISRCHVYPLYPLSANDIESVIQQALKSFETDKTLSDAVVSYLATVANGDARKALNSLEQLLDSRSDDQSLTIEDVQKLLQQKDHARNQNDHYDLISAYIKSLRGSDPDAALYWMARLLEQGESPEFIIRRLIIFASEDIGNADPQALPLATALLDAARFVGEPEVHINLSHVTCYMATAAKSNRSYAALGRVKQYCKEHDSHQVPTHLKDAHYAGAKKEGFGKEYKYPHDYPYSLVDQEYWAGTEQFYEPSTVGYEKTIHERLNYINTHIKKNDGKEAN